MFCKASSAFVIANLSKHLVYFVQIVHKFFLHKIHILTQSILYHMHKCERNEINYSAKNNWTINGFMILVSSKVASHYNYMSLV